MNLLRRFKIALFAFKHPDKKIVHLHGVEHVEDTGFTHFNVTNAQGFYAGDKFQLDGMKETFLVTAVSLQIRKI